MLTLWTPGLAWWATSAPAARRAHETYAPIARGRLYYDGAHPIKADFRRLGTRYRTMAINFGGAVGGADVSYEYNRPNGEVFTARNIQMADNLRLRANRNRAPDEG